ncbi:MAG: hypothetical protein ACE5L7_04800 [Candidatus Aminicenantales bacterium]
MNHRYLKNMVTLAYDPEKCTGADVCAGLLSQSLPDGEWQGLYHRP